MAHTIAAWHAPTSRRTWARRIGATVAAAAMVAAGLTAAGPVAPASAAVTASDGVVSFTWVSVYLYDSNANGLPDAGESVAYGYRIDLPDGWDSYISNVEFMGPGYASSPSLEAEGPDSIVGSVIPVVQSSDLDALGGGPYLSGAVLSYEDGSGTPRGFTIPSPPVLYEAPTPITVTATASLTEVNVGIPDYAADGDTARSLIHITNTSGVTLTIGGTGFAGPTGWSMDIGPGLTADLPGPDTLVTIDHMRAGAVALPPATVTWDAGHGTIGSVGVSMPTVPTEPIDAAVTASLSAVIHDPGTFAVVPLGDAAVGDRLDYTFHARNDGNLGLTVFSFQTTFPAPSGRWELITSGPALTPGASLPRNQADVQDVTSDHGSLPPYVLTSDDLARGFVDITWALGAAPTFALYYGWPSTFTHSGFLRVPLREFTTVPRLTLTSHLNDGNGDGIGQEGETVTYTYDLANASNQGVTVDSLRESAGADFAYVGTSRDGLPMGAFEQMGDTWQYTITAADQARGSIDYGLVVNVTGQADGVAASASGGAPAVVTGAYVAPPVRLDTSATYADASGDGHPSIGETVTVSLTVTNEGARDLTGLALADAAGADVHGLLPAFPGTVPAGTSTTRTFTYVLRAADFARGTLGYSAQMTADGLPATASLTSVRLTDITFAAWASDLVGVNPGGAFVCSLDGTPVGTVTIGDTILVKPEGCGFALPADAGARVVAFSSPLILGVGTYAVKVPVALGAGEHRLAFYNADGTLAGWRAVTVKNPIGYAGDDLAGTGVAGGLLPGGVGGAAALVLLGVALVVRPGARGWRRGPAGVARE